MAAYTSRGRSNSPFQNRRHPSPYSSSSSSASLMNGRLIPRSCSTSATPVFGSGSAYSSRSVTPSRHRSDPMNTRGYGGRSPVDFASLDDAIEEPENAPRQGTDSISVTIRFRPLNEREYNRGDEIAWSTDGDNLVRNEYNSATSFAFGLFGIDVIELNQQEGECYVMELCM